MRALQVEPITAPKRVAARFTSHALHVDPPVARPRRYFPSRPRMSTLMLRTKAAISSPEVGIRIRRRVGLITDVGLREIAFRAAVNHPS